MPCTHVYLVISIHEPSPCILIPAALILFWYHYRQLVITCLSCDPGASFTEAILALHPLTQSLVPFSASFYGTDLYFKMLAICISQSSGKSSWFGHPPGLSLDFFPEATTYRLSLPRMLCQCPMFFTVICATYLDIPFGFGSLISDLLLHQTSASIITHDITAPSNLPPLWVIQNGANNLTSILSVQTSLVTINVWHITQ